MAKFSKSAWQTARQAQKARAVIPIMAATGIPLIGGRASEVFQSGMLQAECLAAVQLHWPSDIVVTFMDLSLEAQAFGASVLFSDLEPPTIQAPIVENETDIERLAVPSLEAGRIPEALGGLRACANVLQTPVMGGMIGPYSLAGRLADMTEFMIMAASEPETAHRLLGKATAFLVDYAKAIKAAGAAGIMIAEPAAGLISPEMCLEFSSEYIARITAAVADDSFMVVLHNCGHSDKLVPEMLASGADAVHCGNAVCMTDILQTVPGNVLVMGNLDPVGILKDASPEKVRQATTELLKACEPFPNFILSSGCDLPMNVPAENLDAFFGALKEYNDGVAK